MKKACFIIVILILLQAGLFGEKLIYQEKSGDITRLDTVLLETVSNQVVLRISGSNQRNVLCIMDKQYRTQEWQLNDAPKKENLLIKKSGDQIIKDKNGISNTIKIQYPDSIPWVQEWGFGLKNFVLSDSLKLAFWSFHPYKPDSHMKMEAEKIDKKLININGKDFEALHIIIRPEGLAGLFWQGHFYFRLTDGCFLMYEGTKGHGGMEVIYELVSEE